MIYVGLLSLVIWNHIPLWKLFILQLPPKSFVSFTILEYFWKNISIREILKIKLIPKFSTLKGGPLKLVNKFTYLGSSVSSTEKDISTRLSKAWRAIDRLSCGPMLVTAPNIVWLLVTVLVGAIVFVTTTLASGCLLCQILPCPRCVWKIHGGWLTQFSRIFFWRSGNMSS